MAKLTVKQVAERAGVCPTIVYGWCSARLLPFYRIGAAGSRGKYPIEESDLAAFLESCRVESIQAASVPTRKRSKTAVPQLKHLALRPS